MMQPEGSKEPIICTPTKFREFMDYIDTCYNENNFERRVIRKELSINNKQIDQILIILTNIRNNKEIKFNLIVA
jgi:hypothetical protein